MLLAVHRPRRDYHSDSDSAARLVRVRPSSERRFILAMVSLGPPDMTWKTWMRVGVTRATEPYNLSSPAATEGPLPKANASQPPMRQRPPSGVTGPRNLKRAGSRTSAYMLKENMLMPAVKNPAATGLSRATSRAIEWMIYSCSEASGRFSQRRDVLDQWMERDLVLRGGAPARDLGGVRDARLEPVGAEGSEADAGSAIKRADAPVGRCRRGAGAHISGWRLRLLYDQRGGFVGGGHRGRMGLLCPGPGGGCVCGRYKSSWPRRAWGVGWSTLCTEVLYVHQLHSPHPTLLLSCLT